MVNEAMSDLLGQGLISCKDNVCYEATNLGQATVAASLPPEDGIFVHAEFQRALQAFVMDGEMHVFYMFTPINLALGDIDWKVFRDQISGFNDSDLRVLQFCRVNPGLVNRMYYSRTFSFLDPWLTREQGQQLRASSRNHYQRDRNRPHIPPLLRSPSAPGNLQRDTNLRRSARL